MTNEEREKGDKILGERKGASLNKFLIKILKLYALVHSQWNLFLSFYSNCRNYIFGKSKVVTNWDPRPVTVHWSESYGKEILFMTWTPFVSSKQNLNLGEEFDIEEMIVKKTVLVKHRLL